MFKALARNVMGKSGNPTEKLERICKETGNAEKLDILLAANPAELFSSNRFVSKLPSYDVDLFCMKSNSTLISARSIGPAPFRAKQLSGVR